MIDSPGGGDTSINCFKFKKKGQNRGERRQSEQKWSKMSKNGQKCY
jgi:hypothetical protein